MGNKSQATLYVIIGLTLVLVIGFFLSLNAQQRSQEIASVADSRSALDAERFSLDYYIEGCVRQTVIDAEIKYGLHRIWAAPEIEAYIENNLGNCLDDFRYFKERGYLVNNGNLDAKVDISREAVAVTIDLPVYLKKGEMEITYDSKVYRLPLTSLERLNLNGETRIVSSDGTLILEIPEGTVVTVKGQKVDQVGVQLLDRHFNAMPNDVVAGMLAFNGIPHKAEFSKPVKVTKYYQEKDIPIYVREEELRLGTYDSDVGIWVGLPTEVDAANNKITTYITHFSQMATVKDCGTEGEPAVITNTIVRQECTGCEEKWIKDLTSEIKYSLPSPKDYSIDKTQKLGFVPECFGEAPVISPDTGITKEDTDTLKKIIAIDEADFDHCFGFCSDTSNKDKKDPKCNCDLFYYKDYFRQKGLQDKGGLPEGGTDSQKQIIFTLEDGKFQGYDIYDVDFKEKGAACVAALEKDFVVDSVGNNINVDTTGVLTEDNDKAAIAISVDYCSDKDTCQIVKPIFIKQEPKLRFGFQVINSPSEDSPDTCISGGAKVEIAGVGALNAVYGCSGSESGKIDFVRGVCMKCDGQIWQKQDMKECFPEGKCVGALMGVVRWNDKNCEECMSSGEWKKLETPEKCVSSCEEPQDSVALNPTKAIIDITGRPGDPPENEENNIDWKKVAGWAAITVGVVAIGVGIALALPVVLAATGLMAAGGLAFLPALAIAGYGISSIAIPGLIIGGGIITGTAGGFILANSQDVTDQNVQLASSPQQDIQPDASQVNSPAPGAASDSRCLSGSITQPDIPPEQTLTDGAKDCNEAGNVKIYTLLTASWAETEDCKGKGCEAGKCKTEATAEPVKCGKENELICNPGETCDPTTKECKKPDTGSTSSTSSAPTGSLPTVPPSTPPPAAPVAAAPSQLGGASACSPACSTDQDCVDGTCVDKPKTCIEGNPTSPCKDINDASVQGKQFTVPGSINTLDMDFCDTFGSYSGEDKFEIISTAELANTCFVKVRSVDAIEGVNRDWYLKFDDVFSAILSCNIDSDCGGNYECRNNLCYEKKFALVGLYDVPITKFAEAKSYGAEHLGTYSTDNSLGAEDFLRLNDNLFKTSGNNLDIEKISLNYEDGTAYWIIDDICNDEKWDLSINDLTDLYTELKTQASSYVMINFEDLNCALDYLNLADKPIADVAMFKVDVARPDDYIGKQSALAEAIIKESIDKKIPMKILPIVDVSEATPAWISKTGEDLLGEKTTGGLSPFSGLLFGPYNKIRPEEKDVLSYVFCKAKEIYLEQDCSADPADLVEEVKIAFVSNLADTNILSLAQGKDVDLIVLSGNIGTPLFSSSIPYLGALGLLDNENTQFTRIPEGMECSGQDGDMIECEYKGITFVVSGVGISATSGHEDFIRSSMNDLSGWGVCVWSKNSYLLRTSAKANAETLALKYYDLCLAKGAIIATGYDQSYARTKTITGMSQNIMYAGSPSIITLGRNKTMVFNSGLGGMGSDRFDCNRGYGYWASIYTSNYYLKNGIDQQKSCTTDAVANFKNGALFITFNYNEDQTKAHGEFITVDNQVMDTFEISREIS
ncbi:MAG: hypothetical protein ABIJ34_00765 [archaeon]